MNPNSSKNFSQWFPDEYDPVLKYSDFEKYLSLISSLNGIEEYTLDRDGMIISSNLDSVTITGYEEWEVIGKHIRIFYSPEDQVAGKPQTDLERAKGNSSLIFTGLRVKKRNSSFWAKIGLRTLFKNQRTIGYKMTMQDVTHKAVSDHRLKEFKEVYLSLFNNSFVGFFKFRMTDYSIISMNDKAIELCGYDPGGDHPDTFDQLFVTPPDFRHLLQEIDSFKILRDREVGLKNERWAMISCRYFETEGVVEGVMVDTTALKKSNSELDRLKNELDQFIYHASHELRSPLVSMLGIINLIKIERGLPDPVFNLCNILNNKVNQLDELLRNITSIAYNNQNPVTYERIEWESLIESIIKELRQMFTNDVNIFYHVELRGEFFGDAVRLRTILKNLMTNSLAYFNPTIGNPLVDVKIESSPSEAVIIVEDNGVGIDNAYLEDIFAMFYKATEYPKGPGLGLYIIKAMTDKLEGTIKVESVFGEGSKFTINFPGPYVIKHRDG